MKVYMLLTEKLNYIYVCPHIPVYTYILQNCIISPVLYLGFFKKFFYFIYFKVFLKSF